MTELNDPSQRFLASGERGGDPQALAFEFQGSAAEYFGIWMVNLLLTMFTLGIWSAWAKVRRIRYFYGNTRLDGHGFDYLADGWMLLKGRLIAVVVIVIYAGLGSIYPIMQIILAVAFLPLYPIIINRSLRFQARMTTWRNVRLNWNGTYWESVVAFMLWPLAIPLSLGLAAPAAARAASLYLMRGYRFGTSEFKAQASLGAFYKAFFLSIGYFIGIAFLMVAPLFGFGLVLQQAGVPGAGFIFLIPLVILIAFAMAGSYYLALTRNIVLNNLEVTKGHGFRSTLPGMGYAWVVVSNLFATLLSFGLLRPWAAVRAWRYQTQHLAALPAGSLDVFVDDQSKSGGAFAEEFSDLEGFEIGL